MRSPLPNTKSIGEPKSEGAAATQEAGSVGGRVESVWQRCLELSPRLAAQRRQIEATFGFSHQPEAALLPLAESPGPLSAQGYAGGASVEPGRVAQRVKAPSQRGDPPPVQRVFEYQTPISEHHHVWIDKDTNEHYRLIRGQSSDGRPWCCVERLDGFRLIIRQGSNGQWNHDPLDDEEEFTRLNPGSYAPPELEHEPMLITSEGFDLMVDEEEPIKELKFSKGEVTEPSYQNQASSQIKNFHSTRIHNPLVSHFYLVPIKQGSFAEQSYRYRPDAVGIRDAQMGNEDRTQVGTHLEPTKRGSATPQGRHIVPWMLVRRSIEALRGHTVASALSHLKSEINTLLPLLSKVKEVPFLLKRMGSPSAVDAFTTAELPMDVWQGVLSELVSVYIQLYHLSEGALFKGKSENRDEGGAAEEFTFAEEQMETEGKTSVPLDSLRSNAEKLIDAPLGTLPPKTLAYAVRHWVSMLTITWPRLMKAHGQYIIGGLLGQSCASSEFLPKGGTMAELLTAAGYPLSDGTKFASPLKIKGEQPDTAIDLGALRSEFVSNVTVYSTSQGQPTDYVSSPGESSVTLKELSFAVTQVGVSRVDVSDRDRPPTQFLNEGQKSHTVAWTLFRASLMSYAGRPLSELLDDLEVRLTQLKKEVKLSDAIRVADHAMDQLTGRNALRLTIFDWHAYASQLVKHYVHVHQAAPSTSYADPRALGRALPNAEGSHMHVLRINEHQLMETGKLVSGRERVIEAALALFDICIPKKPLAEKDLEKTFMYAYDIWKELLSLAFPTVMKAGWTTIFEAVKEMDVGHVGKDVIEMYRNQETGYGISHRLGDILKRHGRDN
ncbi:hypothetical protein OU995_10530 [Roseateles sp. SL47]|uniref:hypothetical protein n=1 Tax=Roseateles sp. SL47 TaxID=2995138 RepID=UPI00227014EF|nr:hypothetical protein [Roseateles sp. SL47]WAC75098.1 hypothetical protein OU995_10530 [Roseateles sp. SL47]